MQVRIGIWRRVAALLVVAVASVLIAACGSSSSSTSADAQTLLKETFSGPHKISSGVLNFSLTLTPSGSSSFKTPISMSLNGPFQSRGSGQLPASNFTISADALGHHGELGVISTGSSAYVVLQGTAYQLPAADFQKLEQSFASSSGSGTSGGLSKLGIKPLDWLTNPTTVGSETVGGANTTHIRAQVNVSSLLSDLNTFLQKASASAGTTTKIPTTIPPATQQKIAQDIKNPTVDIWTGNSDHTLRKLSLNLNVPVSGSASTQLGGLTSAGVGFTLAYSDLNQPQTITAPASVKPFTEFATKLQGVLQQIESTFGGGTSTGGASGTGTTGGSGTPNANNVNKYTQCIQKAAGDVTKMQKCASLLQGSGG